MADTNEGLKARAEMEAAKEKAERDSSSSAQLPRRYRLYDKIKDHVSLRTVDLVIAVTSLLIVVLLVYGIVTGSPQQ